MYGPLGQWFFIVGSLTSPSVGKSDRIFFFKFFMYGLTKKAVLYRTFDFKGGHGFAPRDHYQIMVNSFGEKHLV